MNAKADYQHDPADGGALRFTGSLSLATWAICPIGWTARMRRFAGSTCRRSTGSTRSALG